MAETFYTALGVPEDADVAAIRDAYRDRVKERHPDVSDDPDAPREFRRLTAARDVLTDEDERARYDRLGHTTYVDRHVETSVWTTIDGSDAGQSGPGSGPRDGSGTTGPESGPRRGTGGGGAGASADRHRRAGAGGGERSTWLGDDWERPGDSHGRDRRTGRSRGSSGPVGSSDPGRSASADSVSAGSTTAGSVYGTGEEPWQQASAAYQYTPTGGQSGDRSGLRSLGGILSSVAPWLVVHVVLFVSAVAMAWYMYVGTAAIARFSILAVAFGILLVSLVAFLSVLHLVSVVYG